jgi:hypothetical protein
MSDLAPVTGDVPVMMAPVAPPAAAHAVPSQEIIAVPAPAPASVPVTAPHSAAPQGGDVLAGFGADLPLVMAMQQVIPPGYQYSFTGGVNPGVLVSWEGGRPWQQVLADMLARQGLGFKVQENTVVVGYYASPAAPQQHTRAELPPSAMQAEGTEDVPAPIDGTQPLSITQQQAAAAPVAPVTQAPAAATEERVHVRRHKKPFWKRLAWWQKADEPAAEANDNSGERTASESDTATYWGTAETAEWRNEAPASDRTAGPGQPSYRPERLISQPPAPTPKSEDRVAPGAPGMTAEPGLIDPPPALSTPPKSYPPEKSVEAAPAMTEDRAASADAPVASADAMMSASADGETGSARPVRVASAASAPASTTDSAVSDAETGNWQGGKGQTLRDVLKSWADKAGVELYWSIDYDYRLTDSVGYPGSFDEAVGRLLDKFAAVRPQPYGQLHQGSSGPRVLVIKSYDLAQ